MRVEIIERRYWYGPKETTNRLLNNDGSIWRGTHAEAMELIDKLNVERYELSHNEYRRAKYSVTYRL